MRNNNNYHSENPYQVCVCQLLLGMIPLIKFDSDMTLIKIFHVRVRSVPETVRPGRGCDNYWKLYLLTPKFSNTLR